MGRIAVVLMLCVPAWAGTVSITIDAAAEGATLNPRMHGIFLEEINLGVDGGLYAEMIRNRGFEEAKPPEGYERTPDGRWVNHNPKQGNSGWDERKYAGMPFWSLVAVNPAAAKMELDLANPLNPVNPRALRLEISDASNRVGIANEGFWGINIEENAKYNLSFYARAEGFDGTITAMIESKDGTVCVTPVTFRGIRAKWMKYTATFKGLKTDRAARLVLLASTKGKVWFDMVSLFPAVTFKNRANGLRADIAQMLADMKPGFVRFPGGCVVEGGSLSNAYNWKKTVGPVEQREEIWGTWGFRRTHGMGFFEYFQFCEDIGAEPLPVLFAGESCGYRDWELVPTNDNAWVIGNYLDLMDYTTAPASSPWGKLRVDAGHPKPFDLHMIEIGNENAGPAYNANYPFIYKAIKAKEPSMKTIACFNRPGGGETDRVDDHYYNNPFWFLNNSSHYDKRDRSQPTVYVGEYAVTSGCGKNGNMIAALAEAAFALGMERNGDVVRMCSYAPLLANLNAKNWNPNLINFDNYRVFGTPAYYVQKMLMHNCPDVALKTEVSAAFGTAEALGGVLKLVARGTTVAFKDVRVEQGGKRVYEADFAARPGEWTRGGRWMATNGCWVVENGGESECTVSGAWNNCVITLKACKTDAGVGEGFAVVFGRGAAGGMLEWNVGGWGNKRCAVIGAGVDNGVDHAFQSNHWYDVRIELDGMQVRASLDGQIKHEVAVPSLSRVFAEAGRDTRTGEIIVKAVNTSGEKMEAKIETKEVASIAGTAHGEVLRSASLDDENTLEEPTKIAPKPFTMSNANMSFPLALEPYSFTVLRLKAK